MNKLLLLKKTIVVLLFLFGTNYVFSQSSIKGKVTDALDGSALPGVNVVVKGTQTGTVTDMDGNFTISAGAEDILQFTMIGYLAEEVAVENKTVIDVVLALDVTEIDEVVFIGYGTQKKSDLTGSVAVVNTENLEKIASSDISKVLQGQTSGVQVFGGGEPGAQQKVQIRGIGTFGDTQPLYVIDGVPIAPATNIDFSGMSMMFENNAEGYGNSAPSGGIADFNPSDIESIQVLKDASAAAIYGARGANGVVIITTKRGKAGQMKVNYEGKYGTQNIAKRLEVTNRVQFQELNNLARTNALLRIAPVNNPNNELFIDDIDTDWQKETFTQGNITDHSLSIMGGTDASNYYASVNYFDQTGTVVGSGPRFTKYSAQLNLDQKKGRFKIGQSLSFSYSEQIRLTNSRWTNYMMELVTAIPIVPVYDTSYVGGYGGSNANYLQAAGNPIAFNNLVDINFSRHRFMGVVYAEMEILKGLSYRINLSYDRSEWYNREFVPAYQIGTQHTWEIPELNEWRGENPVAIMEHLINFNKSLNQHTISAVAGYTAQKDHIADLYAHAEGFTEPYLEVISAVPEGQSSLGKRFDHAMLSYLGRLNYSFASKYLLTASWRRDYSSNFGPNNRHGDFPSFAAGWKLSNESFFKVPFISSLKLRGGWGKIGNEKIGAYQYETTINNALGYVFGSSYLPGSSQTYYRDPSIRWEERITTNSGFDMTLLDNKIELSAEYYNNKAKDILMDYPIPISSGAVGWSIPAANGATMINQGIEVNLSYRKKEGEFNYEIGGNFTTLKNKVTKIGQGNLPVERDISKTEIGRSMGEIYGYVSEGIFQSLDEINNVTPDNANFDPLKHAYQHNATAPGDVKFKDINGVDSVGNLTGKPDGRITEADQTYLGKVIPTLNFGLNLSAEYKGFDLSIFIQGIYGNKVYNEVYRRLNALGSAESNFSIESYNNYWIADTIPNQANSRQSNTWPRPTIVDRNGNNRISDRWVQDGSYIRVQNVMLGYSIPKTIITKLKIENLRVYVQVQNLFTFTKMYGYDPDFINDGTFRRGYAGGSYPSPRSFIVGVKIGL